MQHLDLTPLPCVDRAENPCPMRNVEAGFVDEAVVLELLSGAAEPRAPKILEQLALAADDMDYAGWPPTVLTDMRLALRS